MGRTDGPWNYSAFCMGFVWKNTKGKIDMDLMSLKTKIVIGMAIVFLIWGGLIWIVDKMQDADR